MFCIGRNLHITNEILVQDNGKTIHEKKKTRSKSRNHQRFKI